MEKDKNLFASNAVLPEVKITEGKAWISINDKLPETRKDFETMCELQYISKPVFILTDLNAKWKDNLTGEYLKEPIEIKAYYVERQMMGNSFKGWSLSDTGTGAYSKLEVATHWREA